MRLCTCGAALIEGVTPGSPGWCVDECDLKTLDMEAPKQIRETYWLYHRCDGWMSDSMFFLPKSSDNRTAGTYAMQLQGEHSVKEIDYGYCITPKSGHMVVIGMLDRSS